MRLDALGRGRYCLVFKRHRQTHLTVAAGSPTGDDTHTLTVTLSPSSSGQEQTESSRHGWHRCVPPLLVVLLTL